jgi:hypothetical protein
VQTCNSSAVQCITLPSVNHIHPLGVQEQREKLLLLEIIEHDGVRHDLTEAGHDVKLSDHFCNKRTSGQRGSRHENATYPKKPGSRRETKKISTVHGGRGRVAGGGARHKSRPPEAESRGFSGAYCRAPPADHLEQRSRTGETWERAGEAAESGKWEVVGGRMKRGSKKMYLARNGEEGG